MHEAFDPTKSISINLKDGTPAPLFTNDKPSSRAETPRTDQDINNEQIVGLVMAEFDKGEAGREAAQKLVQKLVEERAALLTQNTDLESRLAKAKTENAQLIEAYMDLEKSKLTSAEPPTTPEAQPEAPPVNEPEVASDPQPIEPTTDAADAVTAEASPADEAPATDDAPSTDEAFSAEPPATAESTEPETQGAIDPFDEPPIVDLDDTRPSAALRAEAQTNPPAGEPPTPDSDLPDGQPTLPDAETLLAELEGVGANASDEAISPEDAALRLAESARREKESQRTESKSSLTRPQKETLMYALGKSPWGKMINRVFRGRFSK